MALDLDDQYDKIYRYCFYRLHNRELAEDVTQETFLRWFASDSYRDRSQVLQYLYTIARNLCTDEFRRQRPEPFPEDTPQHVADPLLSIALREELDRLNAQDRELILLRYVNEVPVNVLCKLYGQSRFSLYRRMKHILNRLRDALDGTEA